MGTRSAIARQDTITGKISAIYCHWDGYISNNGKILSSYYDEDADVKSLIALGDLSSLGSKLNGDETHTFNNANNDTCVAYGRDRGETGVDAREFNDVAEFVNEMDASGCEYFYLFDGENWFVCEGERDDNGNPVFGFLDVAIAYAEDSKIYG